MGVSEQVSDYPLKTMQSNHTRLTKPLIMYLNDESQVSRYYLI